MATASRLISLNLGSQTISLAEFRMQAHGGLVLQDYRLREISTDPTSEGMRRTQITAAVRELMNELRIKQGAVNYALPAQIATDLKGVAILGSNFLSPFFRKTPPAAQDRVARSPFRFLLHSKFVFC